MQVCSVTNRENNLPQSSPQTDAHMILRKKIYTKLDNPKQHHLYPCTELVSPRVLQLSRATKFALPSMQPPFLADLRFTNGKVELKQQLRSVCSGAVINSSRGWAQAKSVVLVFMVPSVWFCLDFEPEC